MDEEERNKKLRAGKEKLAAFQKKKSKKKHGHHHERAATSLDHPIEMADSSNTKLPNFVFDIELNHMLHRLCGPPSIHLSFNLAAVLPRRWSMWFNSMIKHKVTFALTGIWLALLVFDLR